MHLYIRLFLEHMKQVPELIFLVVIVEIKPNWKIRLLVKLNTYRSMNNHDVNDRCGYVHNLSDCEKKVWKKSKKTFRYSKNFSVMKKCKTKFDCLVAEMFLIKEIKPSLNVQSDSIRAKVFI